MFPEKVYMSMIVIRMSGNGVPWSHVKHGMPNMYIGQKPKAPEALFERLKYNVLLSCYTESNGLTFERSRKGIETASKTYKMERNEGIHTVFIVVSDKPGRKTPGDASRG